MLKKSYLLFINLLAASLILAGCSDQQGAGTAANTAPAETKVEASTPAPTPAAAEPAPAATTAAANLATPETGGHTGVVEGVITDASGKPVAGAFVKMKSEALRLGFMVISQDGGKYTVDRLPAGSFVMQSVGGDFQSDLSAPVDIVEGATQSVNLTLSVQRGPDLPAAWPRRIPERLATLERLPAGAGKDLIAKNCGNCHSPNQVAGASKSAEEWAKTIEEMNGMMKGGGQPEMSAADMKTMEEYLATNNPPMPVPDPNSRFPHTLLQGEARNYRVVQYDVPNLDSETHDVAVDPWGIGWANQRIGGKVSRFDPVSYEYTEIEPPLLGDAKRARAGNLQINAEGIMWLADPFSKRWLSYDIANAKWTDWLFPMDPKEDQLPGTKAVVHFNGGITDTIRGPVQGNSIVLHPDGTIWMSGPGAARRLDPKTGEWSTWDTPTWLATKKNPGGYGITVDGKGRVWMAEDAVDKLARFDATTGEVIEVDLEKGAYPRRMDHDPDGNVWVGLWGANKIARIDNNTDEMSIIEPPIPYNGAYSIDFDKTAKLLWVTLHTVDNIARYNPASKEWLLLPMMQAETDVRRVEVDQNRTNRVWWSSVSFNARIGYLELLK